MGFLHGLAVVYVVVIDDLQVSSAEAALMMSVTRGVMYGSGIVVDVVKVMKIFWLFKRKRKRSDSVLWQKPLHQQKCQKDKVTTQTTPQKSSIKQRLRTDLGRSVGVTTATQLVWLTGLRAHLPTNRNSRLIKRKEINCILLCYCLEPY